MLNENDLIESLEYYIERNKITSKQTAGAYVGYLGNLFRNLENDYKIQNDVYINGNFIPEFYAEVDKIITKLNSRVNTATATDEEYEYLIEKIKLAETKYSYNQAITEWINVNKVDSKKRKNYTDISNASFWLGVRPLLCE